MAAFWSSENQSIGVFLQSWESTDHIRTVWIGIARVLLRSTIHGFRQRLSSITAGLLWIFIIFVLAEWICCKAPVFFWSSWIYYCWTTATLKFRHCDNDSNEDDDAWSLTAWYQYSLETDREREREMPVKTYEDSLASLFEEKKRA